MTKWKLAAAALAACGAMLLCGQDMPPGGRGGRGGGRGVDVTATRSFDQQSVERGEERFGNLCASCHGADARGGAGLAEVDLVRSVLVLDDLGGKQIGEFLNQGHPAKNKTVFPLTPAQLTDIAAFLHHNVSVASERGAYKYLNVLVGNAAAGDAYFNGAGGCAKCHSVTGDLKGIGAKYDPPTLQMNIVTGGGASGRGGRGGRGGNSSATARRVTVTEVSGKQVTGTLVTISDFLVTLRESSGAMRTFFRNGDTPKVAVVDPLQAHLDLMRRYTDDDMHNLTAYLTTLK